jgi:hypothetical protein
VHDPERPAATSLGSLSHTIPTQVFEACIEAARSLRHTAVMALQQSQRQLCMSRIRTTHLGATRDHRQQAFGTLIGRPLEQTTAELINDLQLGTARGISRHLSAVCASWRLAGVQHQGCLEPGLRRSRTAPAPARCVRHWAYSMLAVFSSSRPPACSRQLMPAQHWDAPAAPSPIHLPPTCPPPPPATALQCCSGRMRCSNLECRSC